MLLFQNRLRERRRRVLGHDRDPTLGEDRSVVVLLVDHVDGAPVSLSPAASTASCTCRPYIPCPPYFGRSAGWTLMTRPA